MQITFLLLGTRGDVQPYLAFALGLKAAGHKLKIAAPLNFEKLIKPLGLHFHPIHLDFEKIFDSKQGDNMLASDGKVVRLFRTFKEIAGPLKDIVLQDLLEASKNAEAILYTPIAIAGYYIGKYLNIPAFPCVTQPMVRTGEYINPLWPQWLGFSLWTNKLSYTLTEQLYWQVLRPFINPWLKAKALPKAPVFGPFKKERENKLPFFCGYSPTVAPKPPDLGSHIHVTGYWFLKQTTSWVPPDTLVSFLGKDDPPVCIGFGSMKDTNMYRIFELAVDALEKLGQRGILLTGWSGIEKSRLAEKKHILVLTEAPHSWLLPRVSAVMHHGGAGTTAAILRAGKPSVVIPFFFDQTFWGKRIAALGASPKPLNRKKLTSESIFEAIREVTTNDKIRVNAKLLKSKMENEDGVKTAVSALHSALNI